jgi:putative transposase
MSTYTSIHFHVVFSTKERRPQIADPWRSRLHEYLGGTINAMGGQIRQVGGVADHVHLLMGLKATHCLADVMRELKRQSSIWAHEQIGCKAFQWQEGYAAFTVSADNQDAVIRYIANQEEHHRKRSFREELVAMLQRAGIAYDDKYLP